MPYEHLDPTARAAARSAETASLLFPVALLGAGWIVGGYFTLFFLERWLHLPWNRLGWSGWLIPTLVSCVEVVWWPYRGRLRRVRGWRVMFFYGIAGFDVYSTSVGLLTWLWTTFALTTDAWIWCLAATASAVVGGYVLTFAPERLTLTIISEARKIWGWSPVPTGYGLEGTRPLYREDNDGSFHRN